MIIDALVFEIGSTTTVANAFTNLDTNPLFLGQGFSETTVEDVNIGLNKAIDNLKQKLQTSELIIKETFASSSAAGGLKMSVHGLVYDMTVKAAKEAALGAGANLSYITAGVLRYYDLNKIKKLNLNIISIAGGVDDGETRTALENSLKIAGLKLNIPIIYAGNKVIQEEISEIFRMHNQEEFLYITKNVYPKIDILAVEDARIIIQNVFEKHITKAKGMERIREIVDQNIIPTPGAVMDIAILLQKEIGDLVVVDIGGATTDVHSVLEASKENEKYISDPEPFFKRTVEGDLGVFINKDNLISLIGKEKLAMKLNLSVEKLQELVDDYQPLPDKEQIPLTEELAYMALEKAILRHSGKYVSIYSTSGKKTIIEGKDLTNAKYLIGTGGALTRLPHNIQIITELLNKKDEVSLKPKRDAKILIDKDYIMASLGVLSKKHPEAAIELLKKSLEIR